jgi:type VI secretion system protein ImpH
MTTDYRWKGDRSVEEWLFDEPHAFEFFQAVHLLEMRVRGSLPPTAEAASEPVRFRASMGLEFAPGDIQDLRIPQSDAMPEMTVSFLSTGGVGGPLPTSFSEEILERTFRGDTAVTAFLDIFHHRLISLLYAIRKAHAFALISTDLERTSFAHHLFSLIGLGLPAFRDRLAVPDRALLRYAGLFWTRPRSSVGLAALVSDYFDVPIEVRQFEGGWASIVPEGRTFLGVSGQNTLLGRTTVLGTRVWMQDHGIEMRVGPLNAEVFDDFLPGGSAHVALAELTHLYAGRDIDVRLQLVVRPADISPARLGKARLGWSSWLLTRPASAPDDQVHVRLSPAPGQVRP